jgi:hypothetical protein
MRRGIIATTALGVLGMIVGCHAHGVCDCDVHPIGQPSYGITTSAPPPAPVTKPAEPIGTMPKPAN